MHSLSAFFIRDEKSACALCKYAWGLRSLIVEISSSEFSSLFVCYLRYFQTKLT
jgi:hypothetical protein